MKTIRLLPLAILAATALACAKSEPERKQELTQREKDSVFAQSRIPGAKAVGKALQAADSANARQARIDSAQQAP
ncbi:MAG: hypothetical protein ACREMS_05755 [Gemmatimonadaceae bacterium]